MFDTLIWTVMRYGVEIVELEREEKKCRRGF